MDRQTELAEAKKHNPDTAAWLYIPGAEADDPVMQAEDNGYYLNLDENREYSVWGCYYTHCENTLSGRDELDKDANTRKNEIYNSFVGQVDTGEAHTESVSFFRQIGTDVKRYAAVQEKSRGR